MVVVWRRFVDVHSRPEIEQETRVVAEKSGSKRPGNEIRVKTGFYDETEKSSIDLTLDILTGTCLTQIFKSDEPDHFKAFSLALRVFSIFCIIYFVQNVTALFALGALYW